MRTLALVLLIVGLCGDVYCIVGWVRRERTPSLEAGERYPMRWRLMSLLFVLCILAGVLIEANY